MKIKSINQYNSECREFSSVRNSVWDYVWQSVRNYIGDSVWDSVRSSVWYIGNSVWDSVGESVKENLDEN